MNFLEKVLLSLTVRMKPFILRVYPHVGKFHLQELNYYGSALANYELMRMIFFKTHKTLWFTYLGVGVTLGACLSLFTGLSLIWAAVVTFGFFTIAALSIILMKLSAEEHTEIVDLHVMWNTNTDFKKELLSQQWQDIVIGDNILGEPRLNIQTGFYHQVRGIIGNYLSEESPQKQELFWGLLEHYRGQTLADALDAANQLAV